MPNVGTHTVNKMGTFGQSVSIDLETSADEAGSDEEDGEAGDHGREASLEHARGHEGE